MEAVRRILVVALFLAAITTTSVLPASAEGAAYFAETQQEISPHFVDFFYRNGGIANFGYPIGPEILVNGQVIQYFERSRMEFHPSSSEQVQLGLLGLELTNERYFPPCPSFSNTPGHVYFPQTGHSLQNGFLYYWLSHGGVRIFGFPISEELSERNADNGNTYTVQYFERARFEYHPEFKGTQYEVELGLLGKATFGGYSRPAPASLSSLESQLLQIANQARSSRGLAPAQIDDRLTAIARSRSNDMVARNYFSHQNPDGKYFEDYLAEAGIGFQKAGEILAQNNYDEGRTAATAIDGFLNSPSHRDILLDAGYTRVGVGHAVSPSGMHYFTMIFLR